MTETDDQPLAGWTVRAVERAPSVERSRRRSAARAQQIVAAARRLVAERGSAFTTQDLVKEAGLAVQTLYKYFPGKDHVLLAVLEDIVADAAAGLEEQAVQLSDPLERLHLLVNSVIGILHDAEARRQARFIAAEHWRLAAEFPEELRQVTRPIEDFVERQLRSADALGALEVRDPTTDAWLTTQLLMAVYHHHAFRDTADVTDVAEQTWTFCLRAWGGRR